VWSIPQKEPITTTTTSGCRGTNHRVGVLSFISFSKYWLVMAIEHVLLFKQKAVGSLGQPRRWNCSKCIWWPTSNKLSRIKAEETNCLHWVKDAFAAGPFPCLSIILNRRDDSSIQVIPATYLLSLCLRDIAYCCSDFFHCH